MIWLLPDLVRACRVEGKGHGIFFPPSLSWQGQRSGHFSSMVSTSPRRAHYGSSSHGRPFPTKATGQQDCLPLSHQPQDGRSCCLLLLIYGCLCVFCLTSLTLPHTCNQFPEFNSLFFCSRMASVLLVGFQKQTRNQKSHGPLFQISGDHP